MSESAAAVLHGDEDGRWLVPAIYAALVLFVVSVVVLPGGAVGDALYRLVFPLVLFGTPPVVSGLCTFRGGGLVESIAIGAVPTAAFVLFGRSEALAVGTASTVALLCLGGALVGFVAGYAGRELLQLYHTR